MFSFHKATFNIFHFILKIIFLCFSNVIIKNVCTTFLTVSTKIDKDLKFDKHVSKICSKENGELNAVTRMRSFLSAKKRRIIFNSFIESQFKHCPLTWMFYNLKSKNKINRQHERSLRIVNNDYENTYEELLSHNNYFSIHDQNIHCLATETYKVDNDLSVGDFKNLFDFKDNNTLHSYPFKY